FAYEPIRTLGINFKSANPTIEFITKNLEENLCYVLEINNEIVSTISLRMPWSNNPGPYYFPHIRWFATSPKYKNKHFDTKLLTYVEQNILLKELYIPALQFGLLNN